VKAGGDFLSASAGLLGPTLRAEVGDTVVVTFRNMASGAHSIHPHGVAYGKQSEGAHYFDNTSQKEKEDDVVPPGGQHVYSWEVQQDVSPQAGDPACLTYSYVSHQHVVEDFNSGLIGALLVCKAGSLDESGMQVGVQHELVFLFGVFDEAASRFRPGDYSSDGHVKYTINGYSKGALPGVSVCAHSPVSLHLLGMSSEPEVFSVHVNGQVLQHNGHKVSSVGLVSGAGATAAMVAVHAGRWLLSSHVAKHMESGMHAFVDVEKCDDFQAPRRRLTIAQKRESREWKYYIAAEEVTWDYAPDVHEHIDEDFKLQYLTRSATRIGSKYKKAVYSLYTNESFSERLETRKRRDELGILGPVIRAQIRDVVTIVFKNMASRPYSIYPHGLTIEKSEEGVNYPDGGNHSHGVLPGETHTYVWRVVEEDEPLPGDSRCLTRVYHSAVDTPRDIASGLIGPILICKSQSLNVRNVQLKADKEQHAMFAVFDENKSWYLEDNIRQYCDRSKVHQADSDFYKSNVMHTINGYSFETGPLLGFCNGEVATWHVSSIGAQDYIQTATFYGHPFELNERVEDILSLYPMTGETISMDMENIGVWLLASLNSHETTKGMRVKFQDVECYRDYAYEYDYTEKLPTKEFTVWSPPSLVDIKKEEEEKKEQPPPVSSNSGSDMDTLMYADLLGLRSLKNQTNVTDVDQLDLSILDYDVVDVLDGETNHTVTPTRMRNQTAGPTQHALNQTGSQQAARQNTTHVQTRDTLLNSVRRSENSTRPNNGSMDSNRSVSQVDSSPDNGTISVSNNTTDNNSTEQSAFGNGFPESTNVSVTLQETANLTTQLPDNSSSIMEKERINSTSLNSVLVEDSEEKFTRGDVFYLSKASPHNTSNDNVSSPAAFERNDKTDENDNSTEMNHLLSPPMVERLLRSHLWENKENETGFLYRLTHTSPTGGKTAKSSSEELGGSESSEEVIIYLQENNTEVIKTTSIKTKDHNWTYDITHQTVPAEIPEHMKKYLKDHAPKPAPAPKKVRKVNMRQRPHKGQGMKTKKRKEYKPQARSGLPFSPRGFNPGMSPRGSRPAGPQPFSDEEELVNMPVVIGVPRPDFSDYELYVPGGEPDHLGLDEQDVKANEYEYVMYKDPYSSHEDIKNLNLDETAKYYLKLSGPNVKTYFIAAEEVEWDYAGYGNKRPEKTQQQKRETKFTKVVFRGYLDASFNTPDIRGEIDEHLGILGPVIKAEVGQNIMVVFKNKASRPYSLHPNGVSYTKQTEGLSYEDGSKYWYKYDNEVQPNTTFTYLWKVGESVGPKPEESDCRTWAYYSGVNPERDIHSGLIGPLLVCKKGTMEKKSLNTREFMLLFMTFDESQSWYYMENREILHRKSRRRMMEPIHREDLKFYTINGIIHSLKGLRMYAKQLAYWHLINMGPPKDVHTVHFHGQTFIHKKTSSHRQAVFPLLPGSFATLEMYPSRPGLWQLETEVGLNQQRGMQTLFLVLDDECYRPLGLELSSVQDNQITAINTRGRWLMVSTRICTGTLKMWRRYVPHIGDWFLPQVDFQRPVVISQVATQGAKQMFHSQYVTKYSISYSNDRRKWIFYKGDSRDFRKIFDGNQEAYGTKKNTFFPPVVGRFVRLHPLTWYNTATVRMEFYGCELDGCSVPLGMETRLIEDHMIKASSMATSWYSGPWKPSLARLNLQGTINAWRAKYNDMNQWLQVELPQVKKITGIITQGAKSLGSEMYVMSYILQYSDNGVHWTDYTDDQESQPYRGNMDNNDHVRNYIYPPIFSRFIRIVPKSWIGSITMRIELLGCDFE
uniref:ferroxidase n=1 Tax=Salarias fasciatus TaxID=181472 RepID=A0A672ICK9_SALFA